MDDSAGPAGSAGFGAADDQPVGLAPTAAAQPVFWRVEFVVPALGPEPVAHHSAEWLVAPGDIDLELFAHGELTVFLAGYHRSYGPKVAQLLPGTKVECVVSCDGAELVRVARRTPDPEASER